MTNIFVFPRNPARPPRVMAARHLSAGLAFGLLIADTQDSVSSRRQHAKRILLGGLAPQRREQIVAWRPFSALNMCSSFSNMAITEGTRGSLRVRWQLWHLDN